MAGLPAFGNDSAGGAAPSWGGGTGVGNTSGAGRITPPRPTPTGPSNGQTPPPGGFAPSWGGGNGQGSLQPPVQQPTMPYGMNPGFQSYSQPFIPRTTNTGNAPVTGAPVPGEVTPGLNQTRAPGGNPNGPGQPVPPFGTGAPDSGPISQNPLQPTASEIAGLGPANIQQFGGTPTIDPTYAQAAQQGYLTGNAAQQSYAMGAANQVNPNQNLSYMNYYGQLLNQGLQPQFQSQDQSLADQLAARGLTSSGTGQYLTNQLMGQQASALAQGLQPIVSQGYGYTQQDIQGNQAAANQFGLANLGYVNQALGTNAGYQQQMNLANLGYGNQALGTNAAYQQQANLANAGASNEADVLNAQLYNQDRYSNYGAYNQYMNELLGLGGGQLSADQAAYLNSFGPSTGVESAYGNALSGMQNVYGNVYGNALGAQQQQMQQAAMLAAMG